jgi:hypothetical protein
MLVVEARGPREKLTGTLSGVKGVRRVADTALVADDGGTSLLRYRLEVESEAVAEAVFSAVAAVGCTLRELHREQTSLEDVFASLTTAEPAEAGPFEPPAPAPGPATDAQAGSPGHGDGA